MSSKDKHWSPFLNIQFFSLDLTLFSLFVYNLGGRSTHFWHGFDFDGHHHYGFQGFMTLLWNYQEPKIKTWAPQQGSCWKRHRRSEAEGQQTPKEGWCGQGKNGRAQEKRKMSHSSSTFENFDITIAPAANVALFPPKLMDASIKAIKVEVVLRQMKRIKRRKSKPWRSCGWL